MLGAGAVATVYGANKQSQDNKAAQAQNAQLQTQQNNSAWTNYLMTRGMAPTSPISAGVIPTEGQYRAVNTRLPLWATVSKGSYGMPKTAPSSVPAMQRWQKAAP
jgi:hypothetical protein